MIYFLYGSREFTKRELKKVRDALLAKRPDALSLRFDENSADKIDLGELAQEKGLFEPRFLVELDSVFSTEAFAKPDKNVFAEMQKSENIFFVLEEKLPKKTFELIKSFAEKTSEEKAVAAEKKSFSAFLLADALGARNKQQLWILFREAVERDYSLEELHGILFWQAKMLMLAHKTDSAVEAGVSNFPYSKAKGFVRNYSVEQVEELLGSLSSALLESREKNIPLENSLERVILGL